MGRECENPAARPNKQKVSDYANDRKNPLKRIIKVDAFTRIEKSPKLIILNDNDRYGEF